MISTMNNVEEVMCGGDVNFLAVETQWGGVVTGKPENFGIDRTAHKYQAIYQRTNLNSDRFTNEKYLEGKPFQFTTVQEVDALKARQIHEWATLPMSAPDQLACQNQYWTDYVNQDLGGKYNAAFWKSLWRTNV